MVSWLPLNVPSERLTLDDDEQCEEYYVVATFSYKHCSKEEAKKTAEAWIESQNKDIRFNQEWEDEQPK